VVILNAAAALVVAGMAENFRDAAKLAERVISSGAATEKLQQLAAFTNSHP
jgi:anthranilate phosphoribosyltransferase